MTPPATHALVTAFAAAVAGAGCTPAYEVPVGWTLDGEDPAETCAFQPDGNAVRFTIESRDRSDTGDITETIHDAACGDGNTELTVGSFATVVAELVVDDGTDDVVYGTSGPIALSPGAPDANNAARTTFDIELLRGTLHADFLVSGRSCAEAGASTVTVSLFQVAQAGLNEPVAVDVEVPCTDDGAAEFTARPIDLDASYSLRATTTIGDVVYGTPSAGKGIEADAANTFVTVNLQRL